MKKIREEVSQKLLRRVCHDVRFGFFPLTSHSDLSFFNTYVNGPGESKTLIT